MLHASTQQLIRKLCELTDAGAINWKEGKGQISLFETEGYVVEIQPEPPSVRLLRSDGPELESADAADLATPWGENEGTFADHVADMARRANRYARGAETAIAKILSSLSAPPKKPAEPEPAALAFAAIQKPAPTFHVNESAAAIAALNADLESQRRKAAEPPPASHSVANAPPPAISPETETAIDRVLAIQPPVVVEKPKEELKLQAEPVAVAPPAPVPVQPAIVAPRPAPVLPPPVQAVAPAPAPATPMAKAEFGAIDGFARAHPPAPMQAPATPQPAPTQPQPAMQASSGLLMRGFSVQSRQTVEPSTAKDFYRPATGAAQAPPPQQPAPAKPDLKPEPAKATGKDVYKPWG